jgi:D-cysteine desulfhydrase
LILEALPDTTALGRLLRAPRFALGKWPTPLEPLQCDSGALWVKRDDLSGFGRGGVKTRKIEHMIAYLAAHGYQELITVVANITNLAHDLGPALARAGIRPAVLAVDEPSLPRDQRANFFREAGAPVTLLGKSQLLAAASLARTAGRSSLRRRTFIALPSLSHPAAVAGAACGFIEMAQQFREMGDYPGTVFITVASGATYAGFLLAESALREAGLPLIRIIGVQVHQHHARPWIAGLTRWSQWKLGLTWAPVGRRIELNDGALEGGFGRFSEGTVALCRRVQERFDLRIDPIFGGKTWSVMERWLAENRPRGPVVYWHCGYTPDWESLGCPCAA